MANLDVFVCSLLAVCFSRLGLNFRLYSCEVLFNRGLATIYSVIKKRRGHLVAGSQVEKTDLELVGLFRVTLKAGWRT